MKTLLPCIVITLSLQGAFSAAAQQRPLTVEDVRRNAPKVVVPSRVPQEGTPATRAESLVLAPYDDTALRLALELTGAEFLKGVDTERLVRDIAAQRAETMRELLPQIRKALEVEEAKEGDGAARFAMAPRVTGFASALMPAVASDVALPMRRSAMFDATAPNQWPDRKQTSTIVGEYEVVVDGMTANVRDELTLIFEERQVGWRHVKRETVEQNGDPSAVGRYMVESGTIDADGTSTVKAGKPRRLKPTSTHRATTETISEARVDRCPDAAGLARGQTHGSLSMRATSGAMGNGSPLLVDMTTKGTSTGRVDDAAALTGFDWEVTAESRIESLGDGENFRLENGMSLRHPASGAPSVTMKGLTITGVGTDERATKAHAAQEKMFLIAYLPLVGAYERAEESWRGGGCVALTPASGAEPKRLPSGEARRLVVEARHRYEAEAPAVPVEGTGSLGTLTPGEPVKTPAAAFVFTPKADGKGGGSATFKSISRRGIARDIHVYFDESDVEEISIEYGYSGFAFVDATAEDCPSMRPDGREVLTAQLRLVGIVDGSRRYEGTGRFSADIDGCGLTPNRADPGQINGGDPGWGGFRGDSFLGCTVTTVVPERTVQVSLRVSPPDDESPGAVDIRWTPISPAADARVASPCEPPWHAEHVKRLTEKYRGAARLEITDYDLMPKILDGGALRPGTYTDPEGSVEGTWTLTVKRAQGRKP